MPEIPTEPSAPDRGTDSRLLAAVLVGVGSLLTGIGAVITALR